MRECPCGGKKFHLTVGNEVFRPVWICSTCGKPSIDLNPEVL